MSAMLEPKIAVVEEDERVRTLLRGPRIRLLEALRERPNSASGLASRLGLPRQTQITFTSDHERTAFAGDLQAAIAGLVSRYQDAGGSNAFTLLVAAHPEVR